MSRQSSDSPVLALMKGAAEIRDGGWVNGAPSHIFPELLSALERDGWQLNKIPSPSGELSATTVDALSADPCEGMVKPAAGDASDSQHGLDLRECGEPDGTGKVCRRVCEPGRDYHGGGHWFADPDLDREAVLEAAARWIVTGQQPTEQIPRSANHV